MKKIIYSILAVFSISVHGSVVSYTFDGAGPFSASVTDMGDTAVSAIAYTQGTTQSGGGASDVAYESNVPGDNLFAISSADIDTANAAYQINDSRLQFALTVGAGETAAFSNADFNFDLVVMNASDPKLTYIVNSRVFYNVNGTGWIDASGGYHQINTSVATKDHDLNTQLFADAADALLTGSVNASADVYESSFNVDLDAIGTLSAGDSVEFALFVWDNKDGNASFYTGVDNVGVSSVNVVPEPVTLGLLGSGALGLLVLRRIITV